MNNHFTVLGWMGLGSAPGKIFGTFDAIMMVMQIIGVPIFSTKILLLFLTCLVALQWFLLFLPLFIISVFVTYNDDDGDQDYPTAHQLFKDIFSSADYWNNHIGMKLNPLEILTNRFFGMVLVGVILLLGAHHVCMLGNYIQTSQEILSNV